MRWIRISIGDHSYEVQDSDSHNVMTYCSGPPYVSKWTAIRIARALPLGDGWRRQVRHVGNGRVVWSRG